MNVPVPLPGSPAPAPGLRQPPTLCLLALALALLAACGDSLVDHRAVKLLDVAHGATCEDGLVLCGTTCTIQTSAICGATCSPCGAPPANAAAICTPTGPAGARHDGVCGFECADGLLRCGDACCSAALVAAGKDFACATSTAGEVHCWGANDQGQLGDGAAASRPTAAPVPGLTGATAIAAGESHACAVHGATVSCWGKGAAFGAAGLVRSPAPVAALAGVVALTAGAGQTCGRTSAGAVRCAGAGAAAGGGPPDLGGVALDVASGDAFTCALLSGGAVKCWGADEAGQLGRGSTGPALSTPVTVAVAGIQAIAAGSRHACGIDASSLPVFCWGDGSSSQLGRDGAAGPNPPVNNSRVKKPATAVHAGGVVSCALLVDAAPTLKCWSADLLAAGPNAAVAGEEADVAVSPGAVSVGRGHTCLVDAAGKLGCFGHGAAGQLGNGGTQDSRSPVFVKDR